MREGEEEHDGIVWDAAPLSSNPGNQPPSDLTDTDNTGIDSTNAAENRVCCVIGRAGASPPSRTTGTIFLYNIYIYIFRWYVVPQFSFYTSTSFQFSPMCRLLYIYIYVSVYGRQGGSTTCH